jgi:hypothetical protein
MSDLAHLAHLARCVDLREADVAEAVSSRAATRDLVALLASKSAPNTGVAKVLLVFARMATTACDWIDGDLHIELVGDEENTVIEALTELGGGMRERLFPPTSFRAPVVEFLRAIERVPHLVAPLVIQEKTARRISLAGTATLRRTSSPPPPIEIAVESLYVRAPAPSAPRAEDDELPLPVITGARPATAVLPPDDAPAPVPVHPSPSPASPYPPPRPLVEPALSDVDQGWDD